MSLVDVVVIAVLLLALLSGLRRGLLENLGVVLGFALGGVAAYALVPVVVTALPLAGRRALATAVFAMVLLVIGTVLGGTVGHILHRGVERTPLRGVERALGGVVSVVVAALVLSFTASTVTLTASPTVAAAVGSSRVLGAIGAITPPPVEAGMSQLRATLLDDGLPRFTELLAAEAGPAPAALDHRDEGITSASASVARISGTAFACGTSVTGSGFVIAPGRILTNAHVVAGVARPLVELPGGRVATGSVVYFDPVADLAVVAFAGVDATPLVLAGDVDPGAAAVVVGYPYGGPLETVDAAVLFRQSVDVPNIEGSSSSPREVYALRSDVRPGNSGGPLLTAGGGVAGLVFARGADGDARGYAMTDAELRPVVDVAPSLTGTVDTGVCAG